ncbi:MAG TPA: carbohydrate ABC transporter permease [Candidatus Methylomirabilis sp.]|nr:carbohydrate ABC transporter permease [Candidatus Methylomirabilis sp.]
MTAGEQVRLWSRRYRLGRVATHLIVGLFALVTVTPYLWLLSTSLKLRTEVFTPTPKWIPWPINLGNYAEVFDRAPFGVFLVNTIIVVSGILAVQLVTITLAAYVFARRKFRGADILFLLFLIQMMVPIHATFLPNFLTLRNLDLLNTRVAMMLPFFASGYGTFLLRQAFKQIPRDLEDAAVIDGCGGLRFLWHVLVPLAKPTLVAFALISLVSHWNDYLWPLIVTDTPDVRTLTIGLGMFVQQESGADWTLLMAATAFVTAPLMGIFLVFQRRFIESFMFSGLKG